MIYFCDTLRQNVCDKLRWNCCDKYDKTTNGFVAKQELLFILRQMRHSCDKTVMSQKWIFIQFATKRQKPKKEMSLSQLSQKRHLSHSSILSLTRQNNSACRRLVLGGIKVRGTRIFTGGYCFLEEVLNLER